MQRCDLVLDELAETAEGICGNDAKLLKCLGDLFRPSAIAYTSLCEQLVEDKKEFFGLRDFYSFIKMLVHFAIAGHYSRLTKQAVSYAVMRNFGGFKSEDAMETFMNHLEEHLSLHPARADMVPNQGSTSLGLHS